MYWSQFFYLFYITTIKVEYEIKIFCFVKIKKLLFNKMNDLKFKYTPDFDHKYEVFIYSSDHRNVLVKHLTLKFYPALLFLYDYKMRSYEANKTPLK